MPTTIEDLQHRVNLLAERGNIILRMFAEPGGRVSFMRETKGSEGQTVYAPIRGPLPKKDAALWLQGGLDLATT